MKDLLTFIFYVLASREQARISEADANPDKWYEVITDKNGLTEVLQQSDTLAGIVYDFEQYMDDYRFDEINIVLMENRKSPTCIYRFFSDAWIYKAIHDYFRRQESLNGMRFVGDIAFQEDGIAKFKKEYYNYGEQAEIFIDEIAFCYFRNLICYIPDLGEEDNPKDGCTYDDFLEIAEGNKDIARYLFDEVTWEYPSTLYEQWGSTGALDELVASEKYEVVVENKPEASEYLSDEVMMEEFNTCPDFRFRNRENNQWEIIDGKGVIYSGVKEDMELMFQQIINGKETVERDGDLKLIEVHCLYK